MQLKNELNKRENLKLKEEREKTGEKENKEV